MPSDDRTQATSGASSSNDAIVAMLDRFFHYFALQQLEPAAALWDVPALILGDFHVHGPMSRPQLERLLEEAVPLAQLESLAGQRPRAGSRQEAVVEAEGSCWLAERVVRVHARWPEQRFGGFLSGVESSEFIVRIDEDGLPKIRSLSLLAADYPRPWGQR